VHDALPSSGLAGGGTRHSFRRSVWPNQPRRRGAPCDQLGRTSGDHFGRTTRDQLGRTTGDLLRRPITASWGHAAVVSRTALHGRCASVRRTSVSTARPAWHAWRAPVRYRGERWSSSSAARAPTFRTRALSVHAAAARRIAFRGRYARVPRTRVSTGRAASHSRSRSSQ
jgi:hypothetical protein